jgi:exodeoxyribonuclease VII large subunit
MLPDDPGILTVTALTRGVKTLLESHFPLVRVTGELSNLARPRSGHLYFNLKDENAQVGAVAWRNLAGRLRFALKDGLEVIVTGRVTVYEPRGVYQVVASMIEPKGVGALELAFRQLKEKLEKEGLFDPDRKKPLPRLPATVGVVTSPTGAAVRDILRGVLDRCPRAHVVLAPVRVQGEGAAAEIAAAVDTFNALAAPPDVLIVGRGGGSIEDLWAFNEEAVARAIHRSRIPVISAVGHEVDVTIADLVADARAMTPTHAGELAVPRWDELTESLARQADRLRRSLRRRLELARERLVMLGRRSALARPMDLLATRRQRLDELAGRGATGARHAWRAARDRAEARGRQLASLDPRGVLARGYSMTLDAAGGVVRSVRSVSEGDRLRTVVADGAVTSTVESREPRKE